MTYKFDIVSKRKIYYLISVTLVLIGIASLLIQQLNLGIDFESGSRLDIEIGKKVDLQKGKEVLRQQGFESPNARVGGKQQDILIFRTDKVLEQPEIEKLTKAFSKAFGTNVNIQEQVVDPIIGRELAKNAIWSVLIASIGIILYITFRFEYRFAVAAILALFHDALVTIGFFSLFQIEVDIVFIAAILTIIGYSVNDTIVIFDRIRENLDAYQDKITWDALAGIVNRSIAQTLVRSLNTALTVIFAAIALYLFGGESIRNFALALLIGLFAGAYSSIFIASQIWLDWKWKSINQAKTKTS